MAVFRPGLARVGGGIAGIGDRDDHRPALRPALHALGDVGIEEIVALLLQFIRRYVLGFRGWNERPAHRLILPFRVREDEAVEAVVALVRVRGRPRRAARPCAECADLRMRGRELLHGLGIALVGERALQIVEGLRRGDGEERGVDHRGAPLAVVGHDDAQAESAHPRHGIRCLRIGRGEIEAPGDGVGARGEHFGFGERRAGAVGFEIAAEADAFRVIAPEARHRAAGWRQAADDFRGREALWRQPARCVGKCRDQRDDDSRDEDQRGQGRA